MFLWLVILFFVVGCFVVEFGQERTCWPTLRLSALHPACPFLRLLMFPMVSDYMHLQDSQGLHFVILGFGSSSGAVHSKVQASVPMALPCDYVWLLLRPGAVVAEEIEEVRLGWFGF